MQITFAHTSSVVPGSQPVQSYPSSSFSGPPTFIQIKMRVKESPYFPSTPGDYGTSTARFLGLWVKPLTRDKREQVGAYVIMLNCCKSCMGRGASKLY